MPTEVIGIVDCGILASQTICSDDQNSSKSRVMDCDVGRLSLGLASRVNRSGDQTLTSSQR